MCIKQREPAKNVLKKWKSIIDFFVSPNVVLHDGNGRTSRGFMIKLLIRYGMPPFYIDVEKKEEYYNALEIADKENDFNALYEYIFKALIRAHVELETRPKTI